jgi:glycosyltransferase involved in cell wall biosynthesis
MPPLKQLATGKVLTGLIRLYLLIKGQKIDIIHVNGSRACFYGGLVGRVLNIPVIWHVRETQKDLFVYDLFLSIISNVIICVSKSVQKKRFKVFGRVIDRKIKVIYNGVDTTKFRSDEKSKESYKKELNVDVNDCLFGSVANIYPLKGQDFIINGFAKAKKLNPGLSVKLLFVGRLLDSEYKKSLEAIIAENEIKQDVIFLEYTSDVKRIYSALDVFTLPSIREGFSRSLLESMSMGLPVLATNISAIKEAVAEGENAILVNYNDVNTMAAAIKKLSENVQLRLKMGINNRNNIVKRFDLTVHTESIQKIYSKLSCQSS